ncbi:hypothetical protein ACFY94_07650 [Streptomyces griseorubiginosus]|uniref:hypothetical protein n=1 Tax=Streptomyces griseorubiginosus TaxID=67304 RepID=UPI0036E09F03
MGTDLGVPPETIWRRIVDLSAEWWRWPFFVWFRERGVWLFVALGGFYVTTAVVLGCRWAQAAQIMLGYANPFDPKVALDPGQRYLAILLRFAGWIAVPAAVGSTAGLLAAEQKRLLYSRDPEEQLKLSRTDRSLLWTFKTLTWPIKWVIWPLIVWPFIVFPFVFVFSGIRYWRARRHG